MYKKLQLLIGLLFFSATVYAGHEKGGVIITYESVAHVNNNEFEYVLTLYQIYDKFGVSPPASRTVNLTGCSANTSFSLPRVSAGSGLLPLIGSDYCSPNTSIQSQNGVGVFQDTILLPGRCANFQFSTTGLDPFFSTTNISSNFGTAYYQAILNNTAGPSSTPVLPISEFIQAACINKPIELFSFSEADGDSVYYSNSVPLLLSGSTPGPYSYATGFSQHNQVGSSVGYNLDSTTGTLYTTLTSAGIFVITIRYSEYRYDTATTQMKNIGVGRFSVLLIGATNCNSDPFELTHRSLPNPDSLDCGDSIISFATTRKIAPGSLTSSGSEFSVYSTNTATALPVVSASISSDSIISLHLQSPVPGGDMLVVTADTGSDNDVILSKCGKDLLALADTLYFFSPAAGSVSAGFTHSSNFLEINFSSAPTSSNATGFSWDFGDGTTPVNTANPTHHYAAPGSYTVVLTAINDCGISDTSLQVIDVCDTLKANFSFTQSGDSLHFDAGPSSGASQYLWQFGDGNSGSGILSKHTYSTSGRYLVSLMVVNMCGDTAVATDSVEVCAAPRADWTYHIVSSSGNGMIVDFDGTASVNAQSFVWDFGDGTQNSNSLSPTHTYATPSLNYRVSLRIYNSCGDMDERSFRLDQIDLEEMPATEGFSLFPNPAIDRVQLEWGNSRLKPALVELLSLSGQLILSAIPSAENMQNGAILIHTSHLPEGVYVLQITGEGFIERALLVIK